MSDIRCLNCDAAIVVPARFCARCGQRTDTARLSIGDLVRELMHSFANVERGPIALLWALLTRPGHVARDFVDGKRRRHYGPFATLAVLVGASAFAVNLLGYRVLAHDGFATASADLLQQHFNLLLLVQLPLLGVICALVFRAARLNLSEHMVLVAYALSLRAIVPALAALLSFIGSRDAPTREQVIAFWVVWYLYFGWAASQFYGRPRVFNGVKGIAAAALGHGAILALIELCSAAYVWALGIRLGQ